MNLGPRDLAGARPSSPPSPRAARTPRRLQGVGNARCPGGHRNRQRHRRLGHRVLLRHHERPLGLERQWRRGYFHAQGSFTNVTVPAAALGIYANGSTWYASTSLGLAISTDAGATWALRGVAAGVPMPANDACSAPERLIAGHPATTRRAGCVAGPRGEHPQAQRRRVGPGQGRSPAGGRQAPEDVGLHGGPTDRAGGRSRPG